MMKFFAYLMYFATVFALIPPYNMEHILKLHHSFFTYWLQNMTIAALSLLVIAVIKKREKEEKENDNA